MFIYHSHIILIINILRSKLKFWIKDARQEYADEAAKQKIAYDKAMEEYRLVWPNFDVWVVIDFFSEEGAKKPKHASSEDDGHDDDENDY